MIAFPRVHPLVLASSLFLGACAAPQASRPSVDVPAALKPADGEALAFTWRAVGTQIYDCKAGEQGKLGWSFVAPEADLLDSAGYRVGSHGAGPHWASVDGSRTVGTVKARVDAQQASDIPWLLLTAKSAGGAGRMAAVASVQRVNTHAGAAPAEGCTVAADAGRRVKVPYTAEYVFFTR